MATHHPTDLAKNADPLAWGSPQNTAEAAWRRELQDAIRDPVELCERLELPPSLHASARRAAATFPVFAPLNYVDRMQVGRVQDPLLRQVLPLEAELASPQHYSTDPVGDLGFKLQSGLLQKYESRVLLITTGFCAVHCRYCFRRHYPYADEPRSLEQWQPALEQIANDRSIHEVILSGGDPLTLADGKLSKLAAELDKISHLKRLRIHTRLPIVIPSRVNDALVDWISKSRLRVVVVVHANHGNELSHDVELSLGRLREADVTLLNQTVLLHGVNDSVEALARLCENLSDLGVLPYYLHQLDPVVGASHFEVPVQTGLKLIAELRGQLPGYCVPRYVQEIVGENNKTVLA